MNLAGRERRDTPWRIPPRHHFPMVFFVMKSKTLP